MEELFQEEAKGDVSIFEQKLSGKKAW